MDYLEEMSAFFARRVEGYDAHMLNIDGMAACYDRVAACLPPDAQALLDLGCGTGLELAPIFARLPGLAVTGIDLTQAMLDALAEKYPDKVLRLLCASYFDVDLGERRFDAALSVESLHHFTHAEKRGLYRRILRALKPGGIYIEADFTAATQAEEDALFAERAARLAAMKAEEGFWHFDTPCTIDNQLRLLREAGFAEVALDARWGATALIVARKAM